VGRFGIGVMEFTAITSSYGAVAQYTHPDVQTSGSGALFARTFATPHSLFIPLQDTTYEMGATHVCPGSHLCAYEYHCTKHSVPLSDRDKVWPMGWGAIYNQQTTHNGAAHIEPNGPDRVVLIMSFVARPYRRGGFDARMVSLGGTYSILWNQWGHTLSDFVHADTRMTNPQKSLRSLGLIKGNGLSLLDTIIMRLPNDDSG
jgi:ectoine hydroxylase-related dioxygenase (phytanoyl-CoA dioxygenase family)